MGDHKRFSPSSLHRVMTCTASLGFIESLPPAKVDRTESIHARRGTAGHEVSEVVLKNSSYETGQLEELAPADTFLGQTVSDVIIDDDIMAAIVPYIKYCQKQLKKAEFAKEENKLDLSAWGFLKDLDLDGEEIGGTMDYIAFYLQSKYRVLEITDLKTGAGVGVEVEDNPQLYTYALCALIKYYKKFKPNRIKVTIVQQPHDHPKGPIRSKVLTVKQLLNWGKNVLVPKLLEALGPDAKFAPSEETCQWCPGRTHCTARYDHACDAALAEFADVTEIQEDGTKKDIVVLDQPAIPVLTDEQKMNVLLHGDEIIKFINDIKAEAHIKAEKGHHLTGFKLVQKRANRIFTTPEKTVRNALDRLGIHPSEYMNPPSLKSPSQIETLLGAKGISLDIQKKFLDNNVEKPDNGTNLVPESHPGKPVAPAVEIEFAHLIERDDDDDLLAL